MARFQEFKQNFFSTLSSSLVSFSEIVKVKQMAFLFPSGNFCERFHSHALRDELTYIFDLLGSQHQAMFTYASPERKKAMYWENSASFSILCLNVYSTTATIN